MSLILYKAAFLLLLFIILSFFIHKTFNLKKIKKPGLIKILLIILGFLFVFYIRIIVHNNAIFASADESNYINLLYRIVNGKTEVISGPGYIFLVIAINKISGLDFIDIIPLFAFFVTTFYFLIIYLLYKAETKKSVYSLLSCILLLSTTYFLWPATEGRPQQIGMILFFISSILYYRYLKERKYFYPFLMLYFITFIFHILSFFILSAAALLVAYWEYLNKKENLKNLLLLIGIFAFCMFLFSRGWFIYSSMSGGLLVLFYNFPLCLMKLPSFIIFSFAILILLITSFTYFLKKSDFLKYLRESTKKPGFFFFIIVIVVSALFIQYKLESNIHSSLYHNSLPFFIFFQLGNIFFGIMFLFGLKISIQENKTENLFFKFSISLMLLGAFLLVISLFFPVNFNNGLIRIINYWVLFAAPIALIPVMKIKIKWKLFLSILLSALIIISLISTSKDPGLFNNELYWDNSDISAMKWLCSQNGTFLLNHTKHDFNELSKESTYGRLTSILENKENLECKNKTIYTLSTQKNETNKDISLTANELISILDYRIYKNSTIVSYYLKNESNKILVYKEGEIRIYKIEDSDVDIKISTKEPKWNQMCP